MTYIPKWLFNDTIIAPLEYYKEEEFLIPKQRGIIHPLPLSLIKIENYNLLSYIPDDLVRPIYRKWHDSSLTL